LRSNTIHVVTQSQYLQDKDGNNYTSIIAGNKEWIVENLRTTHYADGTPIPNLTESITENQITGWTNSDWGTFSTSGPDISSAIKAAGSYGHATSNVMALASGDVLSGNINCSLLAGLLGQLVLVKGSSYLHSINLVSGINNFSWSITSTGDYQLLLLSSMSGTSMTAIVVANSALQFGWVDDTDGAYCWYDNDIANKTPYGAHYNWYAVDNAHGLAYLERGGVQELDWRIPSSTDFTEFSTELGGDSVSGGHMKEAGTGHWQTPNTGADNSSGFNALPSGQRSPTDGSFSGKSTEAIFHSSDVYVNGNICGLNIRYNDTYGGGMYPGSDIALFNKSGFSIRLVRDL
jgi:uncharacterized protein (TIGR02145 family)